ncbi:MAG: pilus assembly protein PilM [Phycisphaerae bacterium]|nr:pilus assembly protein PilM [Phycisphaerae bacterium]
MISLPRKVLCADWDRRSLRLVVARVGSGAVSLEDAHSYRVPPDVDTDRPAEMGLLIADMLKRHGWRHKRVIVDVSRDKAVINQLKLPPTPLEELAAAVQFQAMRELPFPMDEAVVDFIATQRNEENLVTEVMVAAVRTEVIQRLHETCRVAGLTPARIGLRPYANLVSMRHMPGMADQRVLFIDVGPAMTEIDVMHGSVLAFSRAANVIVPPGGPDVSASAVWEYSDDGEPTATPSLDDALARAVRDLEVEITRTLQAYRATEPDTRIDRVVIAGGTGIEEALRAALDKRLNLPSELYDPAEALGLAAEDGIKLRSFSAALGLTWGLSREGWLELDFLNPKRPMPRAAALKRRLRVAGIVAGVAAVAAISVWLVYGHKLRVELKGLNSQLAELRKNEKAQRIVATQIERINEMPMPLWLDDLLAITEQVTAPVDENGKPEPAGKNLLVQRMGFSSKEARVDMRVVAKSYEDVARLEQQLTRYERDGKRVYSVRPFEWKAQSDVQGFNGTTELQVELIELRDAYSRIAAAEVQRKKDLRR